MNDTTGVVLIAAGLAGLAWWWLRGRAQANSEGPIPPGQPGTPDRTAQNPKTVPWRG